MSRLAIVFSVGLVFGVCGLGSAAEPSGISDADLSSLGLGGMTAISDSEGAQVRGMGNAVAGGSFAWGFLAPLSFSQNVYSASGSTYSQGYNRSYAGLGVPAIGGVWAQFPFFSGLGGLISGAGALAGGASYANNN